MSAVHGGGPAFPHDQIHDQMTPFRHLDAQPGMTLRDYFAAKAMQGMCADPSFAPTRYGDIADRAYLLADAMIAERAK